jgi:Tfp pilus assembly protein PilN
MRTLYKINLYPEYDEKRRAARKRMFRAALYTAILGVEFILLISLGISGFLIREQVSSLGGEVARLSAKVQTVSAVESPEIEVARQLMTRRRDRIEWSPKLAVLSRTIGPKLRLSDLDGRMRIQRQPPRMQVTGTIRSGGDVETVLEFIEALQAEDWLTRDFPEIRLGNLEGGGASRFLLVCEPGRDDS